MLKTPAQSQVRGILEDDLDQCVAAVASVELELAPSVERDLRRHFSDEHLPESTFFVGLLDGRVAGLMGYYRDPDPDVAGVYWAVWLYVVVWARGARIGAALIEHLEQKVRNAGGRKIYLDLGDPMKQDIAVSMYLRRGYKLEGCLRDYFRRGEHKFIYALEL